jgi:hypothetical protein
MKGSLTPVYETSPICVDGLRENRKSQPCDDMKTGRSQFEGSSAGKTGCVLIIQRRPPWLG